MTIITITQEQVTNLLGFAAREGSCRAYLEGLFFEPHEYGYTVTATNGHIMAHSFIECEAVSFKPFILPREVLEGLPKIKGGKIMIYTGGMTVTINGMTATYTPIDATYPDYRRALPKMEDLTGSEYHVDFDAKYLAVIKKLGRVNFWFNKDSEKPAYFSTGDTIGCIMPMRCA